MSAYPFCHCVKSGRTVRPEHISTDHPSAIAPLRPAIKEFYLEGYQFIIDRDDRLWARLSTVRS